MKDKIIKLIIKVVFVPQTSYFRTGYLSATSACLGAGGVGGYVAALIVLGLGIAVDITANKKFGG